ncbi:MAG TPA: acyl carrier protein [Candidatus Eisenbacteria bacterium]|nr:acyl carrier protein [Candidatus Eisenbacteria bacterium]
MSVDATDARLLKAVERLQGILAEVWSGNEGRPVDADVPLRDLGVDSGAVVALLARAQSELGVEWPEDLPPGALESLAKVARTVVECQA